MSDDQKPADGTTELWAESIVSHRTGEGMVNIRLGSQSIGQFTCSGARQYAAQLFEAAEAAESDAFVFKWLLRDVLLDKDESRTEFDRVIAEFRAFRDARAREKAAGVIAAAQDRNR